MDGAQIPIANSNVFLLLALCLCFVGVISVRGHPGWYCWVLASSPLAFLFVAVVLALLMPRGSAGLAALNVDHFAIQ